MARSLWPVSAAALAAISCNACFFPLTFKAGMIAFGATRSGVGMEPVRRRIAIIEAGWKAAVYRDRHFRPSMAPVFSFGPAWREDRSSPHCRRRGDTQD